MTVIKYLDKKVLIIEDRAEMRTQLKSMLARLGVQHIEAAKTGEEGIDKLKLKKYDIVLCDYELGSGKDGQQVLEEVRHLKLLKASSIFVLVTGVQSVDMVMGILELKPDGYITKPLSFEDFRTRLDRVLQTKLVYTSIDSALDENDIDSALDACNKLIQEQPRFAMPTYRIKGSILLKAHRINEAEALYETVMDFRKVAWALLGMAKTMCHQSRYDEGKELLERLSKTNDKCVEAFDWLAKILEAQGNTVEAQKVLQQAVEQSPRALLRQQHLSKLAERNEDWDVAAQASRKAIELGRNSIYKSPQSYLRLARSLQVHLSADSSRDKRFATEDIFKVIEELKSEFASDEDIQIKACLAEGATHKNLGQLDEAEAVTKKALERYLSLPDGPSVELAVEMAKAMVQNVNSEEAIEFINDGTQQEFFNDEINDYLQQMSVQVKQERVQARIDVYNNRGVEFFERGLFLEAIEMFEQATSNAAASFSVMLNAVQAYVTLMQQQGPNENAVEKCNAHFEQLARLPESDQRFKRYRKLKDLFDNLKLSSRKRG